VLPGQTRALPAGITNRVGRSRRTSMTPNILRHAGHLYLWRRWLGLSASGLRRPRPWWSRPIGTDGCSMVARMPRYVLAPTGIRSAPQIPAIGQNDSSRQVLALFDSSSRRTIECRSGLLIRGFGVQVPGGAPVLTWGFIAPGHFFCVRFVHLVAPWLLARTDPAILWGVRSAPVASGLQFAGSAGVRRNPAYAVSSDRQAA
jgi:hypothetical protein